jgi:4-diphosphocytidyl-2-C-methyl-D-erythritol kinase
VLAPAKLNLGLRVLGTRADGYHLIESLFVPVDLSDEVELEIEAESPGASDVQLELRAGEQGSRLSLQGIPTDERNLALRAALRFLAEADLAGRGRIRLTKRIPAAAGLGGGSSDAGAVLRGLASLYPGALEPAALSAIALELGADVPFFLTPRASVVSGIGERIEPEPGLPRLSVLLVNSGDSVDTAEVYAAYDALAPTLTPPTPGSTMRAISDLRTMGERAVSTANAAVGAGWGDCLRRLLVNDLEPAATRLCPPVGRFKTQLEEAGALATGMSGSGATVFGIFASAQAAGAASKWIDEHSAAWTCVVQTG